MEKNKPKNLAELNKMSKSTKRFLIGGLTLIVTAGLGLGVRNWVRIQIPPFLEELQLCQILIMKVKIR